MNDLEKDTLLRLLGTENVPGFLTLYFENAKVFDEKWSYAGFARKAGIASRSFPRDVALGKKRVTAASLPGFVRALKLPPAWKTYFQILAGSTSSTRLEKARERARSTLSENEESRSSTRKIFTTLRWPMIYAALGTKEKGASLQEIASRTKLPISICRKELSAMASEELLHSSKDSENGERYFPGLFHVIFDSYGKENLFREYYLDLSSQLEKLVRDNFDKPDFLFGTSVFSVARADLPRLKNQLWDVLMKFVDNAERAEGDTIAKLAIALTPTD